MLLYNTEWRYDHGMAVNYRGKKFYNIGLWMAKEVLRHPNQNNFVSSFVKTNPGAYPKSGVQLSAPFRQTL